ncbi:class I SAM-dependent methyltransferase [Stappia sp. F7233]|uniref:Class I SAM-dependent methyltransferase n=1 Tax=Stappia albiluteola TaxID=2758565 RepID=A0A839AFM9_9HYPH|nr:cyclopropane-fatty-acyl-phospholipid synthase family protein [Stappia albiluteola]MBA5778660.1 class I SAM-dependent methyltransferase [Stappia albiluteola]
MRLLANLLRSFVRHGCLKVVDADGKRYQFGPGDSGPTVTMRFADHLLPYKIFLNPELYALEAYMDGEIELQDGSTLYDLLYLHSLNRDGFYRHPWQRALQSVWHALRRYQQKNDVERAKRQARHHYDLKTEFYRLFLDDGLNYSCAYFTSPDDRLEDAQALKLARLVDKLSIEPGTSVLEIGGGWGSLAIEMAKAGARVTSLNVSPEQVAIAETRVRDAGLEDRVDFVLKDYREFSGQFDRVVSVGMMEHVGIGHLDAYFAKVREVLRPGGHAVIHSIGRSSPPGTTSPFIRKYIFPGGYVPALSETFAALERQDVWVNDVEVMRLHYYYTLRHWRQRFQANRDHIRMLYDERFCRMWEAYLIGAELSFLNDTHMVFQLILSRERDDVPIVRQSYVGDLPSSEALPAAAQRAGPRSITAGSRSAS